MANVVKLKNSTTASATPTTGQLIVGEVAINSADSKLYTKNSAGVVKNIGQDFSNVSITGGSISGVSNLGLADTTARTMTFMPNDGGGGSAATFRNSGGIVYQDWAADAATPYHARFFLNGTTSFLFQANPGLSYSFQAPLSCTSTFGVTGASTFTGTATFNSGAVSTVPVAFESRSASGANGTLRFSNAGALPRWVLGKNSGAESGSSVGSDFFINSYDDTGALIATPLSITRASGRVTLAAGVDINGAASFTGGVSSSSIYVGTNTFSFDSRTPAGTNGTYRLSNETGLSRWALGKSSTAESGSNNGSDFFLNNYTDGGAYLSTPLTVSRSSGKVALGFGLDVTGNLTVSGTSTLTGAVNITTGTIAPSTVGNTTAQWNASQLQGRSFLSTAPTTSQTIIYNGSNWVPGNLAIVAGGTGGNSASTARQALNIFASNTTSKTAAYTVVASDAGKNIECSASSAAFTVTLPAVSSSANLNFIIRKTDSSANFVTVLCNGTDTIFNSTTYILAAPGDSITLFSSGAGTSWTVIATAGSSVTNPCGSIIAYAGSTVGPGWAICDGAAVSRTTFAKLFAVISTTYGSGDGSTTFNLPNLSGRVPLGLGTSTAPGATAHTLGQSSGEETHALTVSEMPAHTHTVPAVFRTMAATGNNTGGFELGDSSQTNTAPMTSSSVGSGTAHNNLPPYLGLNYIIKTI